MPVKTPVPAWLEPHLPTCEAIVALLAPYAEVAVHDIRRAPHRRHLECPVEAEGRRAFPQRRAAAAAGGRAGDRAVPNGPGRRARDHVGRRRPAQRQGRSTRAPLDQLRPLPVRRHDRRARPVRRARRGPAGRASRARLARADPPRRGRGVPLAPPAPGAPVTRSAPRVWSASSTTAASSPRATPPLTPPVHWASPAPPSTPCSRRHAHEAAAHVPPGGVPRRVGVQGPPSPHRVGRAEHDVEELLALGTEADREGLMKLPLSYIETWGSPALREAVAGTYERVDADHVLAFAGAEEGLFWAMQELVGPGDHAVVTVPCYQAMETVTVATGADVERAGAAPRGRLGAGPRRAARPAAAQHEARRRQLPEQPDRATSPTRRPSASSSRSATSAASGCSATRSTAASRSTRHGRSPRPPTFPRRPSR